MSSEVELVAGGVTGDVTGSNWPRFVSKVHVSVMDKQYSPFKDLVLRS